jgi:succinoglycan biosynthesis protein ExoU
MAKRSISDTFVELDHGRIVDASVDVLIAARDRTDTIERAISSALDQDGVRAVIVIDDGSRDDTAARAMRCGTRGKRLIVERLPHSVGPSAARNRGLEISTAPWFAVLDGDDFFLPGRIAALLAKSDGCDLLADDLVQIRENEVGRALPAQLLFKGRHDPFLVNLEEFVLGNIRRHGVLRTELGFLKPLVRRSFIEEQGLKYNAHMRLGEDYAFYARALAAGGRFRIVPVPGYVSVVRGDSLSALHSRDDLERLRDSDTDLIASCSLTPAERKALTQHQTSVDCRVQWLNVIDAFKSRQYASFLAAFCRSWIVSIFLTRRLVDEFYRRSLSAMGGKPPLQTMPDKRGGSDMAVRP